MTDSVKPHRLVEWWWLACWFVRVSPLDQLELLPLRYLQTKASSTHRISDTTRRGNQIEAVETEVSLAGCRASLNVDIITIVCDIQVRSSLSFKVLDVSNIIVSQGVEDIFADVIWKENSAG
jgi:hypothetical protein